jgi:trigger factor
VLEFYRKNPNAMLELRMPIFEEKVVDFALELADVTETTVPMEDLFKQDREGPIDMSDHDHMHDHDHAEAHDHDHGHGHQCGPDCDHDHGHHHGHDEAEGAVKKT